MSQPAAADARGVDDLPDWVRRAWLVPLILGIALVVLGLILLFNVNASVGTLRWLVVISLVLAAVEAFATASLRAKPWVGWVVGFAYLAGALIGIVWPGVTLFALVIIVGVSFLVGGIVQTVMAWQLRGTATGWGWSFAFGLLSVLVGLILLFGSPAESVVLLAIALAIYVFMTGITLVAMAFAIRRAATALGNPIADATDS
ncbi:MAG TPA: DUF308 domain-containing protein [Jiangellaceae bacterium]|jgi:uncharacterized membrane protein HdeD (DUF308 family)|nr:DUF308 domain-containing protein [Jiangellaceae bacterium]